MADDNLPPTSPDLPHAVTPTPPAPAYGVTTAPAYDADVSPPSDIAQGLLRSLLHAVLGGVVGLALGFLLDVICTFLFHWNNTNSTLILMLGGGLILGVAFSGSLVRLLGLTPRVRPGTRSVGVGGDEGRSEIQLLTKWLIGLALVLVCGWGLVALSYFLTASLYRGAEVYAAVVAAVLSLGLFLLLERGHGFSRFMGLPVTPGSPAWTSALVLWAFGVPGLAVRAALAARETAEAGKPVAKAAPAEAAPADGFREIVETVVFVVVLVLLLKSFAAEAFVIPTGSMAETLLGYQKMVVCPKCGFEFPVNCSQQVDPQSGPSVPVTSGICPNCREQIQFPTPDDPPPLTGDRVLVAKFLYELTQAPPNRLDVVVFKYPGDGDMKMRDRFPRSGPFRDGVPMNYIKRLVGLPGETIAIHGGNLYVLAGPDAKRVEDARKKLRDELGRDPTPDEMHDELFKQYGQLAYFDLDKETDPVRRAELAKQLWEKEYMHVDDRDSRQLWESGAFRIIRKAPDTVLSMRRIVYDNDHPARDLIGVQPPRWADRAPSPAWKADDARHAFQLNAPADAAVHWLGYRHLLRGEGDKPELITDFMGYNTVDGRTPGQDWVGDLSLDCDVDLPQARGELTLELSKGVDRFEARFDVASGDCKLVRVQDGQETVLDHKLTGLKSGTHSLRFADVDERLTVWVDDALPFGDGVTYAAPKDEGPTKDNDLDRPAGVGVKGTAATVRGLKLWRDSYYTTQHDGNPSDPDAGYGVRFDDPSTWRELSHLPVTTLYVQPDPKHYLCLGDNSPESSDGRSWGLVPDRLLLGKAVAIYYPFNRFGRIH